METSDPEIQFGPIPEGSEHDVEDSVGGEHFSAESQIIVGAGDASTPIHQSLQKEREELKKIREENEELRKQVEALKIRELNLIPVQSPMGTTSTRPHEVERNLGEASFADKPKIRPATFDGSTSWTDYKVQFELLAELNCWDDTAKAVYLAASLRGSAQSVLGDLDGTRRRNYTALTAALGQRFGPENQTELFRVQLKNRVRKREETLPELAQAIRRLTRQAYPSADYQLQETLAKENFIDSLQDADIRWRVFQSRPDSLEDAVRVAVELEAFQVADRQRTGQRKPTARVVNAEDGRPNEGALQSQLTSLKTNIEKILTEGLKNLQGQLNRQKSDNVSTRQGQDQCPTRRLPVQCWRCNDLGHISRECPQKRTINFNQARHQGNGRQSSNWVDTRLRNNARPSQMPQQ